MGEVEMQVTGAPSRLEIQHHVTNYWLPKLSSNWPPLAPLRHNSWLSSIDPVHSRLRDRTSSLQAFLLGPLALMSPLAVNLVLRRGDTWAIRVVCIMSNSVELMLPGATPIPRFASFWNFNITSSGAATV